MNAINKLIILDRDGVINHDSEEYIKSPDEWHAISGSLAAIAELNRAGFQVVIATNQSGIARGYYDLVMLQQIHDKLTRELAAVGGHVDDIFFCPHHPDEKCHCRKPQPGMFFQIQEKYQVEFADVFFVGDNYSDIQVAVEVGCKPILVLTGKGQKTLASYPELKKIPCFASLADAVPFILKGSV
jgi:D-glycero-D-manno-heptose 1,7-bisphosphate phosphatase